MGQQQHARTATPLHTHLEPHKETDAVAPESQQVPAGRSLVGSILVAALVECFGFLFVRARRAPVVGVPPPRPAHDPAVVGAPPRPPAALGDVLPEQRLGNRPSKQPSLLRLVVQSWVVSCVSMFLRPFFVFSFFFFYFLFFSS